jgi:hypothetical protein
MSESERPKEKAAGYRAVHPDAQAVLDAARQRWGHVPHLLEAIAASRPVVTTYWHHLVPVRPESLDRTEQLLVELTASVANRCDYCVAAFRMTSGFESHGPLARPATPRMRFLFVRSRLCLQLPSHDASQRRSCRSANGSCHQGPWRTSTSKSRAMPGTPWKRARPWRDRARFKALH